MFPLKDSIPNVHKPVAMWILLSLNSAIFIFEQFLDPESQQIIFHLFGVIPARYSIHGFGSWTGHWLTEIAPFFTYMFLHGGWLHFLLNMWVLWVFADNIEDVTGPVPFVIFYILCGLIALAVHFLFHIGSTVPVIGASGAIAGVMGAYFVLYPHAKVIAWIFPLVFELPAVVYLGLWFTINIVSGLWSKMGGAETGVAFLAHAGGFVAGMLLIPLFRRKDRCYYCYEKSEGKYSYREPLA